MNSTRTPEDARVLAELTALGESDGPDGPDGPHALETDDAEVAVVVALFGLAHGAGPELTPLERRRVWRRLETIHGHADVHEPSRKRGGVLWIGLAAAAALVLVPFFAPEQMKRTSDPDTRATLVAMGQQARRSLGDMPGGQDQTRARALADDYAARLHGPTPKQDTPAEGER